MPIDKEVLKKWQILYKICINDFITIEDAKLSLKEAKIQWQRVKEEGEKLREKYLLDHCKAEINEETIQEKEKKWIINGIKRSIHR